MRPAARVLVTAAQPLVAVVPAELAELAVVVVVAAVVVVVVAVAVAAAVVAVAGRPAVLITGIMSSRWPGG